MGEELRFRSARRFGPPPAVGIGAVVLGDVVEFPISVGAFFGTAGDCFDQRPVARPPHQ